MTIEHKRLKPFGDAGDEITLKIDAPKKLIRCFQCKEIVELTEGSIEKSMLVGTRLANKYPVYCVSTYYEGFCYGCNRTYSTTVRAKY